MVFTWEQGNDGLYVVEHDGAMRTGAFRSKAQARRWFDVQFNIELGQAQNESEVNDNESLSTASSEANE